MEKWRPVKDFEIAYEVSNLGNLRSIGRYVPIRQGTAYVWRKSIDLHPGTGGKPKRPLCQLFIHNERTSIYLSHVVLEAFGHAKPENPALQYVNHKDGDFFNCRLDNLTWGENKRYIMHGPDNHNSKLTYESADLIRKEYALGELSYRQLAQMYDVSPSAIAQVVRGTTWIKPDH